MRAKLRWPTVCTRDVIAAIKPSKCTLNAARAFESSPNPPVVDELGEPVPVEFAGERPRECCVCRRNWRSV